MENALEEGCQQTSPEVFRPYLYGVNLFFPAQCPATPDVYPVARFVIKPIARSIMQA